MVLLGLTPNRLKINSCLLIFTIRHDPRLSVTVINSVIVTFTSLKFNHFFRFLPGDTDVSMTSSKITNNNQMIICIESRARNKTK